MSDQISLGELRAKFRPWRIDNSSQVRERDSERRIRITDPWTAMSPDELRDIVAVHNAVGALLDIAEAALARGQAIAERSSTATMFFAHADGGMREMELWTASRHADKRAEQCGAAFDLALEAVKP